MILSYLIGFVIFLIIICEYYAFRTGVPTVTSFPSARKKMTALMIEEACKYKGEGPFQIIDLGAGTAKLSLELGRAIPKAHITGIEISFVPYYLSRLRALIWRVLFRVKNVTLLCENFWTFDISNVQAVVIFINGSILQRMSEKLANELPSGAYVVSNEVFLPGWEPSAVFEVGILKTKVVTYRKP